LKSQINLPPQQQQQHPGRQLEAVTKAWTPGPVGLNTGRENHPGQAGRARDELGRRSSQSPVGRVTEPSRNYISEINVCKILYNKNKVFIFHFYIFVYLDASLKFGERRHTSFFSRFFFIIISFIFSYFLFFIWPFCYKRIGGLRHPLGPVRVAQASLARPSCPGHPCLAR
jgi:hypothetical protein